MNLESIQLLQVIGRGHGITIGSETSGSVYNGNSRPSLRPAVRGRAMPGAISLLDLPLRNRSPRLCQLLLVTVRELLRSCYVHVRAVTFDNITMANTGTGIRMKTQRGRGGVVSDIVYRNMCERNRPTIFSDFSPGLLAVLPGFLASRR